MPASEAKTERWRTSVGDLEITVRNPEAATGVALATGIFNHAYASDALASHLASSGFSTYQIELPGRGQSSGTSTYEADVEAIAEINERLRTQHDRTSGFGHSLGGIELVSAAELSRFDRLASSGHPIGTNLALRVLGFAGEHLPATTKTLARIADRINQRSERYHTYGLEALKIEDVPQALASYVRAPDLATQLKTLKTATLFLYGENDTVSGVAGTNLAPLVKPPHEYHVVPERNHDLNRETFAGDLWEKSDDTGKRLITEWITSA